MDILCTPLFAGHIFYEHQHISFNVKVLLIFKVFLLNFLYLSLSTAYVNGKSLAVVFFRCLDSLDNMTNTQVPGLSKWLLFKPPTNYFWSIWVSEAEYDLLYSWNSPASDQTSDITCTILHRLHFKTKWMTYKWVKFSEICMI